MECAHNNNQHGFALVEIAIVMVIIGLIVGGIFAGRTLIENMRISKTVQLLKGIQSSALVFRDAYGRLPGDMPNTAARLPNCAVAPCATGGDGNRVIQGGATTGPSTTIALTATAEAYTFWHHLQAADLIDLGIKNTLDMNFNEGQPDSPVGGGFRLIGRIQNTWGGLASPAHAIAITSSALNSYAADNTNWTDNDCRLTEGIDFKMDDGMPYTGSIRARGCGGAILPTTRYRRIVETGDFIHTLAF